MERDNISNGNSDANFSDVFGGPPRRSSMYEMRQRYGVADSGASRGGVGVGDDDEDEATVPYRGSLTGTREKPVFGEDSANRRRKGNDFFSDIFGGHADPFSSKPHSSGISHSSFPAKVMDLPTFGSPTLTSTRNKDQTSDVMSYSYSLSLSQSRFSSQRQEEPKNDVPSFNRQRSLSREVSLDNEKQSSVAKSDLKNGLNGQEVSSHSSQFHFSIYNWASKGVPLMMPRKGSNSSRLKETGITNVSSISKLSMSRSSSKGSISTENVTSFSGGTKANAKEIDSLLRTGTHSRAGSSQMAVERVIALSESTTATRVVSTVDDVSAATVLDNTREKVKHVSHLKVGVGGKGEKEAPKTAVVKRVLNSDNLKPLRSLFNDTNNEQENEGMTVKAGGSKDANESKKEESVEKIQASEKVKKRQEKHIALTDTVVDTTVLKGVARKSESNTGRHKVQGKVKEFAKQFNQEESPKPKTAVDSQIQGSRLKGSLRPEKEASLGKAGIDENFQFNLNKETTLQYESMTEPKVEECLKQSDKHYSASKTENYISSSTSSKPKKASVSSTVPDVSKTVVGDANKSFQRDFVMKELPLEKNEKPQPGEDHVDMQAVDAKIRKWSNGKEGNIRSLLSTLQYILWPESGWKPVPLVDIIEGNAVKRAYQRALLRLHPDKLQQKGAASHQKYIAEKVFDILQEAWNQFNSLGSF